MTKVRVTISRPNGEVLEDFNVSDEGFIAKMTDDNDRLNEITLSRFVRNEVELRYETEDT